MVAHPSGKLSNGARLEVPLFKSSEIMSVVLMFLSYMMYSIYCSFWGCSLCCLANNLINCLSVSDGEGLSVTAVPLAEGFLWLVYTVLSFEKLFPTQWQPPRLIGEASTFVPWAAVLLMATRCWLQETACTKLKRKIHQLFATFKHYFLVEVRKKHSSFRRY